MSLLAQRRRAETVPRRAPVAAGAVVVALATTVVAVVASGTRPRPAGGGLRDAGQLTGWLLPLCRVLLDVAALACVGALLAASLLVAADGARLRMLRVARRCSVLWLLAALVLAMVSASALLGVSLLATVRAPSSYRLLVDLPQGRALLVIAIACVGLWWWAGQAGTVVAARTLLALSLLAMAPLLQTGHAATGSHHYLATQALMLHVLGATLWVGGLLMILLHLRGPALVEALPSFSRVALGCLVTVSLSGTAGAWLRLGTEPEAWLSSYGALVGAKVVLLAALGAAGWWHRERTLPAVRRGQRLAFARLATVEVLLMAVTMGIAVALARTPLPAAAASRVRPPHATTFATVDRTLPAPSVESLLTRARPDALVLTVLVALVVTGVVVLRRRGARSWRGSGRLGAGLALVAWCLCGGLGAYSAALPSAQVAQVLLLGTLAPWLLLSGWAVLTGDRDRDRCRWNPVHGLIWLMVVVSVLPSPLLEPTLRSPVLHLAVAVAALASGLLLLAPLVLGGSTHADARTLLLVLAVVLLSHATFVLGRGSVLGGEWFPALGWSWADLGSDQRRAGLFLGAAAVVLAVLALRGGRADARR